MDTEIIILSQRQIYDVAYMWNLKKPDTDNLNTETDRPTHIESKLTVTKGEKER